MKRMFSLCLLICGLSASASENKQVRVNADEYNFSGVLALGNLDSGSSDTSTTELDLALNYAERVNKHVQGQAVVDFDYYNSGSSKTRSTEIGIGAIYNLSSAFATSYYAGGLIGIDLYKSDSSGSEESGTHLWYQVEFGKRFGKWKSGPIDFNYSPSIALYMKDWDQDKFGIDSQTEIRLNFIQFDFIW